MRESVVEGREQLRVLSLAGQKGKPVRGQRTLFKIRRTNRNLSKLSDTLKHVISHSILRVHPRAEEAGHGSVLPESYAFIE
jgi:hypothetical protein